MDKLFDILKTIIRSENIENVMWIIRYNIFIVYLSRIHTNISGVYFTKVIFDEAFDTIYIYMTREPFAFFQTFNNQFHIKAKR